MATTPPRPALLVTVAAGAALLGLPLLAVGGIALLAAGGVAETQAHQAADTAGVPPRAADAYRHAAQRCPRLHWSLLAAIGAVETRHGQHGAARIDPDTGEVTPWVFGPPLDGTNGTRVLPIGPWTGWWGLTGPWTQATGPMQFLPTTFHAHAVDDDHDGTTNPHDIDDAAATTASYLCASTEGPINPDAAAAIYNPGDPNYAHRLASEQQRIRTATTTPNASPAADTGTSTCPVAGPVQFTDTFGAPRSGGRAHQGVDIFARAGTPVLAPANGRLEHYNNQLGGLSYRLHADDGTYYYGTHLSAYENTGIARVTAGTTIGYVGTTGNAATTPPHLHWEIHPRGRGTPAINPTPIAETLCRP